MYITIILIFSSTQQFLMLQQTTWLLSSLTPDTLLHLTTWIPQRWKISAVQTAEPLFILVASQNIYGELFKQKGWMEIIATCQIKECLMPPNLLVITVVAVDGIRAG